MNVLLELTSHILSVKCLENCEIGGEKNPLLLVLPSKIVLVNNHNGTECMSFPLSRSRDGDVEIRDCLYVPSSKLFIVLLSNASVLYISELASDPSEYKTQKLATQPHKLHLLGGDVFAVCDGGLVLRLHAGDCGGRSTSFSKMPSVSSWGKKLTYLSSCTVGGSVMILVKNSKGLHTLLPLDPIDAPEDDWLPLEQHALPSGVDLPDVLSRVHMCSHGHTLLYLWFFSSSDSKTIWMKISAAGELMFTREMDTPAPVAITGLPSALWVFTEAAVSIWQSNYGVQSTVGAIPCSALQSPTQNPDVVLTASHQQQQIRVLACNVVATPQQPPTYTLSQHEISISVYPHTLASYRDLLSPSSARPVGSLAAVVGSLKRKISDDSSSSKPSKKSPQTVISSLTTNVREVLRALCKEDNEKDEAISEEQQYARDDASMEFLRAAEKKSDSYSDWTDSDWDTLHTLLVRGYVPFSMHPKLFRAVMLSQRSELLVVIASHAVDITEHQCVALLTAAALVSAPPTETPKKKKKSKSASVASPGDVSLLCEVCYALVRRHAGYDSCVLGEALRSISTSFATLLLRVIAPMLRGLCNNRYDAEIGGLVPANMSEATLSNTLCWVEAILEAHFSSLVMGAHSKFSSDVHAALGAVMEALANIDSAIDTTEATMGLCVHLQRMTRHTNRRASALQSGGDKWSSDGPKGLYQLDVIHF